MFDQDERGDAPVIQTAPRWRVCRERLTKRDGDYTLRSGQRPHTTPAPEPPRGFGKSMTDPNSGQPSRRGRPLEPRSSARGLVSSSAAEGSGQNPVFADEPAEKWIRGLAWSRSPRALVTAGLIISVLLLGVIAFVQFVLAPATAVTIGIVLVVGLGAGGLAARGIGELRDSREWKSSGCFLCAAAYLGTATVALLNGVPLIFQQ